MRYLFGPGLAEIYARRDSGGTVGWHLSDKLGSVRQVVNTSGTVLDAITYDSYGNILTETQPSNGDRLKFAGMHWDSEIGQYYVWHRNYLAGPGRFASEDPLGFKAGDSNLYRYVGNNITNLVDPTGAVVHIIIVGAAITVGAIVLVVTGIVAGRFVNNIRNLNAQAGQAKPDTGRTDGAAMGKSCGNSFKALPATYPRVPENPGEGGNSAQPRPTASSSQYCANCCGRTFQEGSDAYDKCVDVCNTTATN